MDTPADRIVKKTFLRIPRLRLWQALTDAREFSKWFMADLPGPFAPGARQRGRVTYPGYEHLTMDMTIERMDAPRVFSWRWHPNAADVDRDYSGEPTTLVVFELEEAPGGTLLSVTESGFDRLPDERRADAFRSNERGWTLQLESIEKYIGGNRGVLLPKKMRAAAIDHFGGIDMLHVETMDVPAVKSDEVLIRVETAGVAEWDPFEREGGFVKVTGKKPRFPYVLGSDGAG